MQHNKNIVMQKDCVHYSCIEHIEFHDFVQVASSDRSFKDLNAHNAHSTQLSFCHVAREKQSLIKHDLSWWPCVSVMLILWRPLCKLFLQQTEASLQGENLPEDKDLTQTLILERKPHWFQIWNLILKSLEFMFESKCLLRNAMTLALMLGTSCKINFVKMYDFE